MKKILLAVALVASVATAAPAVADETTDILVSQLREKVEGLTAKVEHKNDLLACERTARRALERAVRTGEPVGVLARCR